MEEEPFCWTFQLWAFQSGHTCLVNGVPINYTIEFAKMMLFTDSFIAQILLSLLFDAKEWEAVSSTLYLQPESPI